MASAAPAAGSLLVSDWYRCKDSKEYFSKILHKKRRKHFGETTRLNYFLFYLNVVYLLWLTLILTEKQTHKYFRSGDLDGKSSICLQQNIDTVKIKISVQKSWKKMLHLCLSHNGTNVRLIKLNLPRWHKMHFSIFRQHQKVKVQNIL